MKTKPPLKLWIINSIIGGVLGALNPIIQMALLQQDLLSRVVERYGQGKFFWLSSYSGIYLALFFIPCLLSTATLYPWLYKKIRNKLAAGRAGHGHILALGIGFGVLASIFTILYLALLGVVFNIANGQGAFDLTDIVLAVTGSLAFGAFVAIMFLPAIMITGYIFVWANMKVIGKTNA